MFTEEAIEISKKKSASISIFHDDEGKQYFFQNFDRWNIWMEILVYSGSEEFAEITPFEPTIAPSKVLQCKLSSQINFSC